MDVAFQRVLSNDVIWDELCFRIFTLPVMFRTGYMGQGWNWEDKLGICCNSHVSDDGDLTKVSEVEAMGIDLSLEIFWR